MRHHDPGYYQFNPRLTAYTPDRDWRFSIIVKNLTEEVIKFEDNEAGIPYDRPRTKALLAAVFDLAVLVS